MAEAGVELSVVMPCLNEAETLETCIVKAQKCLARLNLNAEIVIADNGSTDGSLEIARRCGVRVVPVAERGYGSTLREGLSQARGKYLIFGDSDDSYDFSVLDPFVEKLRGGADLVMGCRLPSGGGTVMPGAMPLSHRWLGNPGLSILGNILFHNRIHDYNCGLRGLSAEAFRRLRLVSPGMEFASEMVMRASLLKLNIAEVPITLHPDGRSRPGHLRTWRDGWRHLKLMLVYAPLWLFLIPGALLAGLGLLALACGLCSPNWSGTDGVAASRQIPFTAWLGVISLITGYHGILYGLLTRSYLQVHEIIPPTQPPRRILAQRLLDHGKLIGLALLLCGALIIGWGVATSPPGDGLPIGTVRVLIPGVTLAFLGLATWVWGFFADLLDVKLSTRR